MALQSEEISDICDRELLAQFQVTRDEEAFREIVERHHGLVYGVARRMLGCAHSAEDVLQATFLVLARDAKKIRKQGSLASWLYGVAFRTSARLAKQRARSASQPFEDEGVTTTDPLEQLSNQFEQNCVLEELNQLPDKLRTPLVLRYLGEKSNAEVADEMQLSESAVEGRLKRGRNQLRMRLARQGVTFAAAIAVLDAIKRSTIAVEAPNIVARTVDLALGSQTGNVADVAANEALRIAEQEMAKMATAKLIQTAAAVVLATSVLGGGLALSGGTQLWAQNDSDPFADIDPVGDKEVVVRSNAPNSNGVPNRTPNAFRAQIQQPKTNSKPAAAHANNSDPFGNTDDPFAETSAERMAGQAAAKLAARIRRLGHYNVPAESEAEVAILEQLQGDLREPLSYEDTPLADVVSELRDTYEMEIHIDRPALEDESLTPSDTVSIDVGNVQFQSALTLMLEPLSLTTVIRNDVLMITTQTKAEEHLITRIYKINPAWKMKQDQMLEAITTSVLPNSWSTVGGPGSATKIENGLVISNTRAAHEAINKLLGQVDGLYQGSTKRISNFRTSIGNKEK